MNQIIKSAACIISEPKIPIPWLDNTRPYNPRATEGDMIELEDGRLLLLYTHYYGGGKDHDPADIRGMFSYDGGQSWSASKIVLPNDARYNVMSVSLFRLRPAKGIYPQTIHRHDHGLGLIGLVYLKNEGHGQGQSYFRTSADEGMTWSKECTIVPAGYYPTMYVLNGAGKVLSCGRIILPVWSWTGGLSWSSVCYSDDGGITWQRSSSELAVGFGQGMGFSQFVEPVITEMRDGCLLMIGRTQTGRPWQSFSTDRGVIWSAVVPMNLAGSGSPAAIEMIPETGDLLLIWNQASEEEIRKGLGRARLSTAISKDNGATWEHFKNLEALDDRTYIKPNPLAAAFADNSEAIAIQMRSRESIGGEIQPSLPQKDADMSAYPYADPAAPQRGYLLAEYPSITLLSNNRVAVTYDTAGGPWNFEGDKKHLGEGVWTNRQKLPGLMVQVLPLEWFYN